MDSGLLIFGGSFGDEGKEELVGVSQFVDESVSFEFRRCSHKLVVDDCTLYEERGARDDFDLSFCLVNTVSHKYYKLN
jgi:hypothetical protein